MVVRYLDLLLFTYFIHLPLFSFDSHYSRYYSTTFILFIVVLLFFFHITT